MKKGVNIVLIVAAFVLFLSLLILLSPDQRALSGAATTQTSQSVAAVLGFFAMSLSEKLNIKMRP